MNQPKVCILCKHFRFEPDEEDWSEVTPGAYATIACSEYPYHYSLMEFESTEEYRQALLTAEYCEHFEQRDLEQELKATEAKNQERVGRRYKLLVPAVNSIEKFCKQTNGTIVKRSDTNIIVEYELPRGVICSELNHWRRPWKEVSDDGIFVAIFSAVEHVADVDATETGCRISFSRK